MVCTIGSIVEHLALPRARARPERFFLWLLSGTPQSNASLVSSIMRCRSINLNAPHGRFWPAKGAVHGHGDHVQMEEISSEKKEL